MALETTDLILEDVLFRAAEATDGTSDFEGRALININRIYQEIVNGGCSFLPELREDWWWLYAQSSLQILPIVTTGTVAVTQESTGINFSDAPVRNSTGWHIRFGGSGTTVYKISAHTAGITAATLDSEYAGATNGNITYELFKLEYTLIAGIQRVESPMHAAGRKEIGGMDPAAMQRSWPVELVQQGVPKAFASISETAIRFSHMGTTLPVRVDYSYKAQPADLTDSPSSTPVIPKQFRPVLAEGALAILLINKNDSRAKVHADMTRSILVTMIRDNRNHRQSRAAPPPGSIITRPNQMNTDGVLRTETGRIIG
jgi:hypothetical protein